MLLTPPSGYVYAMRLRGVVNVPRRELNGVRYPGGRVAPGYSALVTVGEAEASDLWAVITGLENTGTSTSDGRSMFGIKANGELYYDTNGADAGEEALLVVLSDGSLLLDDLAVTE